MDAFIRKYGPHGKVHWTRQFGTGGTDYAHAVATLTGDAIYVVGYTSGTLGERTEAMAMPTCAVSTRMGIPSGRINNPEAAGRAALKTQMPRSSRRGISFICPVAWEEGVVRPPTRLCAYRGPKPTCGPEPLAPLARVVKGL
jgi:hypothetical protein